MSHDPEGEKQNTAKKDRFERTRYRSFEVFLSHYPYYICFEVIAAAAFWPNAIA
jgi:hypothetical protein